MAAQRRGPEKVLVQPPAGLVGGDGDAVLLLTDSQNLEEESGAEAVELHGAEFNNRCSRPPLGWSPHPDPDPEGHELLPARGDGPAPRRGGDLYVLRQACGAASARGANFFVGHETVWSCQR
jgi:hypothetical protein